MQAVPFWTSTEIKLVNGVDEIVILTQRIHKAGTEMYLPYFNRRVK